MKKLLAGILALSACCVAFTACGGGNDAKSDVEGAAGFLESMYADAEEEGRVDYNVVSSITIQGYTYSVTWKVESDEDGISDEEMAQYVKVTQKEEVVDGKKTTVTVIDVNEVSLIEVDYALVATIADKKGNSKDVTFYYTLTAAPSEVAAPITEAPVEGTAYKFFVYQEANKKECYITGEMANTYFFGSTENYDEGIDLYVENVEGGFYLYHNKASIVEGEEAVKTYINVVQSGTHTNAKYETTASTVWTFDAEYGTIVATLEDTKFYLGCDGTYNTVEPQSKLEDGYYMGYLVTLVNRADVTDEYKVEQTLREVSLSAVYVDSQAITLNDKGSRFGEVSLTWAVKSGEGAAVDGAILNLTAGAAANEIVLTATAKAVSGATDSVDVAIKLIPNDAAIIVDTAKALKAGESFANEVTLTGVVSAIPTEFSEDYKNVTITMNINGKTIDAYRLVGSGADQLKVGYTVTVKGILTNYNGTVQFDKGCEIVSYEEGTEVPEVPTMTPAEILDAAYALPTDGKLDGEYTLTGVITEIDDPYNSQYSNISVVIVVDGHDDKPILCYRMKGTGAENLKVGDTITVTGKIKKYFDTVEFDTGCTFTDLVPGEGGEAPNTPNTPDVGEVVETVTYKMYIRQVTISKVLFLDGGVNSSNFLTMTEDASKAVDILAEKLSTGAYKFHYVDANGAKQYIEVFKNSSSKIRLQYVTETACVFNYNETLNYWYTNFENTDYVLGTYSNYETMSPSKSSYFAADAIGVSQFPAELVAPDKVGEIPDFETETPEDSTPDSSTPDESAPEEGESGNQTVISSFESYDPTEQYAKDEVRQLDGKLSVTVNEACLNYKGTGKDIRIYVTKDKETGEITRIGHAVFTATEVIKQFNFTAGDKSGQLEVIGVAEDGTETVLQTLDVSSKQSYSIDLSASEYKSIKFKGVNAQIRIASVTVTYAE